MANWNRTDYDRLESDDRWSVRMFGSDAGGGISPLLFGYLICCLALLAAMR